MARPGESESNRLRLRPQPPLAVHANEDPMALLACPGSSGVHAGTRLPAPIPLPPSALAGFPFRLAPLSFEKVDEAPAVSDRWRSKTSRSSHSFQCPPGHGGHRKLTDVASR